MAKETLIIFIYDTELLTADSEDPVEAVLYFHPNWVSDTQKLALCGQLMGTTDFLKHTFFKPKVISLQNGKFALRQYGNLLLAVGTDRNISDSLIESRANLLTNLINLYHCNLLRVSKAEESENELKSRKRLSEKLYQILETFLPILQYNNNGNVFQNQPKLRISKSSAGNIFLDAIETLQSCQQYKGVLGGTILYHNKVVATQLSEITTKNLVLTDPLRIKTAAEMISHTGFHVPIGVQLVVAYITEEEYQMLFDNSRKLQTFLENQNQQLLPLKWSNGGVSSAGTALKQRKIKRDKSLIFSNIPEESNEDHPPKTGPKRPTNLSLKLGNGDKKPEKVPVTKNEDKIFFDETDSYPEYIGRTSVCNTPMTENKVFMGSIKPICANPTEDINTKPATPSLSDRRRSSTSITEDITDSLKKISKNISRKFSKTDINKNNGNDTHSTSSDEQTIIPIESATEVEEINRNVQKSNETVATKTLNDRRKLSLPLKPLTSDATDILEEKRRLSTAGIQLTPLIAKLSILAMNDILTPNPEKSRPRRSSKTFENNLLNSTKYQNAVEDRKKVELFICGQQNMSLLLMMEAGTSSKQAIVQKLFDVCVAKLSKIENNLNQTLNMNIQGQGDQKFQTMGIAGASGYSFLSLDSHWDTVHREGPWNSIDFYSMEHMHKDLAADYPITDLIIRTDENVVFGFKSGRNEYYSKQSAQNYNGIPPPSDAMGSISMKTMNHLSQSSF